MEIDKNGASDMQATTEDEWFWCNNCKREAYSRFELSCGHVFCVFCEPADQCCPQCVVEDYEKFIQEDDYDPSNRASEIQATTTDKMFKCSHCRHIAFKRFELSCGHVLCIVCTFGDQSCPQCKVEDEKSNKEEENGTEAGNIEPSKKERSHGEVKAHSSEKNYCKSCSGYTFNELKELPCRHICCFRCFTNLVCQQCKADLFNKEKENSAEASNSVSREGTHKEDREGSSKKYYCKNCSRYTTDQPSELPCHHIGCFFCFCKCQQCKAEQSYKEEEMALKK